MLPVILRITIQTILPMTVRSIRLTSLALALLAALALVTPAAAEVRVIGDRSARCGKTPVEIFRVVAPSVVQIFSFGINPYTIIGRVESKTGSGIFLGDDLVATNFHVVLDASAIAVSTGDTIFEAELIGRDPMFDISILRVPGLSTHIEPIALAPSDELAIGQPAYVIG